MTRRDELDLLIVVGLTGVGKTSVIDDVLREHPSWRLLPNRRELTDDIIVPRVQHHLQLAEAPVEDRLERFRLTAVYRELHPGGMAHALGEYLRAELPSHAGSSTTLVFDNLRGLPEVSAAADTFPTARFLLLDATPETRLARLVERRDPFDRAATPRPEATDQRTAADDVHPATADPHLARLDAIPAAADVFDLDSIAAWAARKGVDPADLARAASIIVEEQRNYDSRAARRFLAERLPPARFLPVDTDERSQAEVSATVRSWLERNA